MCEFISWVERRDKVYFLTGEDLLSKGGQKIIKERCISQDDFFGHGTIRAFYRIDTGDGSDKECTDFSNPKNFPPEIVEAIKEGRFKGFPMPRGLLRAPLYADCEAKRDALYADYKAKRDALDAEAWDLFVVTDNRAKRWQ